MRPFLALTALALLSIMAGCSAQHSLPTTPTHASWNVRIQITDAPGTFDAVNLVVDEVSIRRDGSDSLAGWEVLSSAPGTFDLMKLRNGLFATLGQAMVPPSTYSQIRLKLGAGSNVVVDGVMHPLVVPSGMQSGYKLTGVFVVPADQMLDLALDFDAARSIHVTGNGKYMLHPVVTVMPFSTAGSIAGRVLPDTSEAEVFALMGADTVAHALPAADGSFMITPIAEGTYAIAVHPDTLFRDTTITGVVVTRQQTTQLGDIVLTPK
jgi:hypothetical protein